MSKYIIEFRSTKATAVLDYNDEGWLVKYELDPGAFGEIQHSSFAGKFPSSLFLLEKWKEIKTVNVKEVPPDLSFPAFWKAYDMKVGNKPRCERLWQALKEPERVKAIKYIEQYNSWLIQSNINKKMPETYLNQKPWNN